MQLITIISIIHNPILVISDFILMHMLLFGTVIVFYFCLRQGFRERERVMAYYDYMVDGSVLLIGWKRSIVHDAWTTRIFFGLF